MQSGIAIPKNWKNLVAKPKVRKALTSMELSNPMTAAAAVMYYQAATEVDPDVELAHCVILASKMYEPDQFDLEDSAGMDDHLGDLLDTEFDLDNYMVDERTIVAAMDFNLLVFP